MVFKVEKYEQYFVMTMNWFKVSPIMAANERCLNYLRGELKLAFRKKWICGLVGLRYDVFESEKLRVYLY